VTVSTWENHGKKWNVPYKSMENGSFIDDFYDSYDDLYLLKMVLSIAR